MGGRTIEEYIWLQDDDVGAIRVALGDLDASIYPQLWKPVGKLSYSASSFINLPLPEVPFYLKDWLPKLGKLEIYGQAKAGKSFLSVQLARSIGAGDSFLGIPTEQGRVLYLQCELGHGVLQQRLRMTGLAYENVYVATTFSLRLDKSDGQAALIDELEAVKPSVLILDPLYKMMSGDENEAQDIEAITNFLDQMIEAFGCSIILIHHTGKDVSRGGRGSSVLEGWVDSAIEMRKVTQAGEDILRVRLTPKLLRHAALPPEPLEIIMGEDFEFYLGERPMTIKQRVEEFIRGHNSATVLQMVGEGLGSKKSIDDARRSLLSEGKVENISRGEYRWVEGK